MRQQVAFIGRTSVGKSSLINAILNRKKFVKTSKKPVCLFKPTYIFTVCFLRVLA